MAKFAKATEKLLKGHEVLLTRFKWPGEPLGHLRTTAQRRWPAVNEPRPGALLRAGAAESAQAPPQTNRVLPRRSPLTVVVRGSRYTVLLPSLKDPRLHVAAVLLTVQLLGQTVLGFRLSVAQILLCLAAGALFEFAIGLFKDKLIMWPASGLLTGNSTAIILRVPGTVHGDWWSLNGIWIYLGVVGIAMTSKYVIRWRGTHIFNPSNLGLVLAFVVLGPKFTEPQDLWWIPMGPWMIVTYAVLAVGGLVIGWELKLLWLELGFMAAFAAFTAVALFPMPNHCMVASWHATPICGRDLWTVLVTSPELLVFALFMVPDPRTVPNSQVARFAFGVVVALLSALLIGPTSIEFWTKTAILASLVFACPGRFALAGLVARLVSRGWPLTAPRRAHWCAGALAAASTIVFIGALPISAGLATHRPLSSGTWRPAASRSTVAPTPESTAQWALPQIPVVTIPADVPAYDSTITSEKAAGMAHDAVLDLIIEAEARRTHNSALAENGAIGDALIEFTGPISQDIAAGRTVSETYSFNSVSLTLFLPKYSTQAPA